MPVGFTLIALALSRGAMTSGLRDVSKRIFKENSMKKMFAVCFLMLVFAVASQANVFNFVTPAGSSTGGGPVSASATVTTLAGAVTVVLTDLQANPTDVAQLISDFQFVLSNPSATTGTLASQIGAQINIDDTGHVTSVAGNPTGWQLNNNVSGGLELSALGGGQPADLIIGPAGAGGVYTAANSSIAGNGPHNPFVNGTETFMVNVTGVTTATNVTSAFFSFGTTAGVNITAVPVTSAPEPGTVMLLGFALLSLGFVARRNRAASDSK